jgi:cysteine dioxygenase
VQPFVHFSEERYLRNLLFAGPNYQALVLCWRSGQRSPIHDHRGSSCAVKVIRGVATETIFAVAPNGMIYATGSRRLAAGDSCASQDADIHQLSNLQPAGQDLVSLHVYSPPLFRMHMYSLVDSKVQQFFDPVNEEFLSGAGI